MGDGYSVQVGTRIAPLLAVWYKNSLDEQRAKNEATRKSADRMVNQMLFLANDNPGLVAQQWTEGKPHLLPTLGPDLYKEKLNEIQALAGMQAMGGGMQQGAPAPTQTTPQRPTQQPSQPQPDMGIPPMNPTPAPAPTAQQYVPNEPPRTVNRISRTLTAEGNISRTASTVENPEFDEYKTVQFYSNVAQYRLANPTATFPEILLNAMQAGASPQSPNGWSPKTIDLGKFDLTASERDAAWYQMFRLTRNNPEFVKSVQDKYKVTGNALFNRVSEESAGAVSALFRGYMPNEWRSTLYGTDKLQAERDIEKAAALSRGVRIPEAAAIKANELDLDWAQKLREPIPTATAGQLGLPANTTLSDMLQHTFTPLGPEELKGIHGIKRAWDYIVVMKTMADKINTTPGELDRILNGLQRYGEAFTQTDPTVATYLRFRKGFIENVKGIAGAGGQFTDVDADRMIGTIPNLWDSKDVKDMGFGGIFSLMRARANDLLRAPTAEAWRDKFTIPGEAATYETGKAYRFKDGTTRIFEGYTPEGKKKWRVTK